MNEPGAPQSPAGPAWRRELVWLLLALGLAALVALPAVIGPGIVNTRGGGDSPFLVLRTHQMAQALRSGAIPARWMPEAALGLGYPAFNYYAALPYYVSALGYLGGLGILGGIKLAQMLGFLLAAGAAYALARALGLRRLAAVLVSVAYSYAPFHLVNVYVRGDALSEFYAMALFPLALTQVVRLVRSPTLVRMLGLALAYGALAVTHNISAMLGSPLLVLWLLALLPVAQRGRRLRVAGYGIAGLALGLGLSAWFWIPALAEQGLVQLVDQTTGYFHYAGHFYRLDLLQLQPLFDYTLNSSQDPFRMGLLQTVVTVAGIGVLAWRWRRLSPLARLSGALAAACWAGAAFLMTAPSRPVWDHVPLLAYTQFPWRLLAFQSLFGALLIGAPAGYDDAPSESGRAQLRLCLGASVLGLCLMLSGAGRLQVDRLTLTEADVTPYRLMLYEAYSGNLGGTIRYEFLPADMRPRPYVSASLLQDGAPAAPFALSGTLTGASLVDRSAISQTWRVTLAEGGWLAFQTAAFPAWEGTLDGAVQGVRSESGLGLLEMEVPAGEHLITLTLGRTRVERWSERASLAAGLIALGLMGWELVRRRELRWPAMRVATVGLVLGTVVLLGSPTEATAEGSGPLLMDSVRSPYLHHLAGGVRLAGALLSDYSADSSVLAPGETLTIHSTWTDVPEAAVLRVEMVALTAHLFPSAPAWAVGEAPLADGDNTLQITLPQSLPPGLYALRPTVLVAGVAGESVTAAGVSLGLLSLAPVQVLDVAPTTEPPGALAAYGQASEAPEITLREVHGYQVAERSFQVDLLWRSERQAQRSYELSVRLTGPDGAVLMAKDLPPLAGNYPTTLWIPGHIYPDSLRLTLPDDVDPQAITDVEIVLYDRATLAAIGSVAVPLD